MKTISNFLVLFLFCLSISACSKNETPNATSIVDQANIAEREVPFLAENEIPMADIMSKANDAEFLLTLSNTYGVKKEIELFGNSGYEPSLGEKTYIQACGKKILLIVIKQETKTAVAFGSFFYNTLVDPKTGEWITTFNGSEIGDKDTGKIISDDQKAVLAKLKAGVNQHCPKILDPNHADTGKNVEWLLQ